MELLIVCEPRMRSILKQRWVVGLEPRFREHCFLLVFYGDQDIDSKIEMCLRSLLEGKAVLPA
jgi:hypothetical protein